MRKPDVKYQADELVLGLIRLATGFSSQDIIIGCEVLFAAGLASRELSLIERKLTLKFHGTPVLASRLEQLTKPSADLG